jgi:hypothetical protein|tara:strand:+ start:1242 stop:1685 length:444 start_codon:yes stop_codon:yes gene_type:complete
MVAKEVFENNRSNQFIKKPLSNNSSKNDSIQINVIIEKKRVRFPLRSPNLDTALVSDVSGAIKNGNWSLISSKIIIDTGVKTRIKPVTINVVLRLLGLVKPNSFHVTPLTLIIKDATTKVVNELIRPFVINPALGILISLTKNITDI